MISAGHLLPDLYNQLGIIQKSCIGKSKNVGRNGCSLAGNNLAILAHVWY